MPIINKLVVPSFILGVTLFFCENVYADSNPHVGFFSPERVWTAAGNANLNIRQPDPRSGDLMIAIIAIRPSASTVNTPSGWTSLGSWTGTDGGAEGVDAGSVSLYYFYKVADGTEGTSNQTFTENGTTSVWQGTIVQARSATGTYSVSAGGYSINGDATDWGGTLDTDIGLTAGDVVVVAAAQNGNLANSSGWGISANGVTDHATNVEHGEFSTSTGNDQETGLMSTHIRAGTSTEAPSILLTQSAAASGVVAGVRIRQGSGTNRSDTWVRAAGSQITGTANSLSIPYPEHEIGDMLLMFVANKYDTSTPTTPTDWTSLGTYNGGAGTNTTDSGTARISAFYREATAEFTGTQAITITNDNVSTGQMISVHTDDVTSWILDSDGGADNTADTSWLVTGSGMDLDSASGGDIVLVGTGVNTDARLYSSHGLSASGITFGDVTQTSEYRSTSGTDNTLEVVTGRVVSGSGTGVAPTFTSTADGSATSNPAGVSIFVKILGVADVAATFTQENYRWYVDSDGEDVSDPWSVYSGVDIAENTAITVIPARRDPPSSTQELRLRVNLTVNDAAISSDSYYFKLQYRAGTDSDCSSGSWTDVGSGVWDYATSSVTDGTTLSTSRLTGTDVLEAYSKSSPVSNPNGTSSAGEIIEYGFHIIGTTSSENTRYLFRVVETDSGGSSSTNLTSYTNCATLTTEPGTSDLMRHGNLFSEGEELGSYWTD